MMAYSHSALEMVFLFSVVLLWAMIFYQMIFTYLGYVYHLRARREKKHLDASILTGLPPVSVLVPAHNEALVIEKTLEALLRLDYPAERIEIVIIDDGSSDETARIVEHATHLDSRVRLFHIPVEEAARGKSHALNLGLAQARHDLIAVYDADNTPEPGALKYLVLTLLQNERLCACFGKFRTANRQRNLLTRFINLETLAFQFMIQAGRYLISRIAILPGTNMLVRRAVLEAVGRWDENALTEDTELSIRLYEQGHEIKFVPFAVTWEEEPEQWGTWIRQRTRWVRGSFYVLRKYLVRSLRFRKPFLTLELLHLFLLYYLFLAAILMSHIIFLLSSLGFVAVLSPGPYFGVWVCAFALFVAEVTLAAAYEDEASPTNLAVIALMYFTYCQGWILLVFRATYQEMVEKGAVRWEKTRRVGSASAGEEP